MLLHYEFGGDDDHVGDDYEYDISYKQVEEAIADYFADNYLYHIKREHRLTPDQLHKLSQTKKVLKDAFLYTLKDFDLITDDVEEDLEEVIHDYWEDEAFSDWVSNRS